MYAIKKAKELGVDTILNPAPAADIDRSIFPFIDYFTPNETEASFYVNHPVETHEDASKAASTLLEMGIKNVIITLGEKGAALNLIRSGRLVHNKKSVVKPYSIVSKGLRYRINKQVPSLSLKRKFIDSNLKFKFIGTKIGSVFWSN
jgi:sugar/nucleoside kinase (ribokinase family)